MTQKTENINEFLIVLMAVAMMIGSICNLIVANNTYSRINNLNTRIESLESRPELHHFTPVMRITNLGTAPTSTSRIIFNPSIILSEPYKPLHVNI